MSHKSSATLLALAALAVGYFVGSARSQARDGRADAGPTELNLLNSRYITADADGTKLTTWWFINGAVANAKMHYLQGGEIKTEEFVPAKAK